MLQPRDGQGGGGGMGEGVVISGSLPEDTEEETRHDSSNLNSRMCSVFHGLTN